jgi:hypothetical protein
MKPQVMGQCLRFGNRAVDLGSPIKQVVTVRKRHLVLLDPFAHNPRNVYCFDDEGNQTWQIEAAPNVDGLAKDSWVHLFLIENERVRGRTLPGFEIEIELSDGRMIRGTGSDMK